VRICLIAGLGAALILVAGSCALDADDDPVAAPGMQIHLLGGGGSLPDSSQIEFRWCVDGVADSTQRALAGLDDRDGNGVPEFVLGADAGLLTPGAELRVRVIVSDGVDGAITHMGVSNEFVVERGERRHLDLALYATGQTQAVDREDPPPGRFLHSATELADGRILVTGGFASAPSTDCPDGTPEFARCFDAVATDDAWIFDPATARWHEVRSVSASGRLSVARAGHTATLGPDGFVTVVGGAERALIILLDSEDLAAANELRILPLKADGSAGAHATFDVFDPNVNREGADLDRDGDPGRGGFVPGGLLNQERFLHAAAALRGNGHQVLLAGGSGTDGGAGTWELFDFQKPGGWGVYAASGGLQTARPWPGAVAVSLADGSDRVWIVGGAEPASNADLAEIWVPDVATPGGGTTTAANDPTIFPGSITTGDPERPEIALFGPNTVYSEDAAGAGYVVAYGWYGPVCGIDMPMRPVFTGGEDLFRCGAPATVPLNRNFAIAGETGSTTTFAAPSGNVHAFADAARLPDGTIIVAGGTRDLPLDARGAVSVQGAIDPAGRPGARAGVANMLSTVRIFNRVTPMGTTGALVTGGVNFSRGGAPATIVDAAEAIVLPYAQPIPADDPCR